MKSGMSIEEYVSGFHARLDKIAELEFSEQLKGHVLLRQAGLDVTTRNVIVGSASGCYDISKISAALRQSFRDNRFRAHNATARGSNLFRFSSNSED